MKNKIEIKNIIILFIFTFLNIFALIEFLFRRNIVNYYNMATFLISYKNGFVSRGFIGTILNLIPEEKYLIIIATMTAIGVSIFTIFILIQVFHIFFENIKEDVCYWFLFMMCSSTSIHFLFRNSHTKMDLFWYILFIPIFIGFLNFNKHKIRNIIFLFLFSIMAILIHQAFIFVIAPFILVLLWDVNERKILIPYTIIIGITFLICQFCGKGNYELILQDVYDKTYKVFSYNQDYAWTYIHKMLYLEYKMPVFEHFHYLKKEFMDVNLRLYFFTYIFNFINICILIKLFINMYKKKTKLYIPFLILSQLPLYVLTIDYERWFTLFLLNMQLLIIYGLRNKKEIQIKKKKNITYGFFIINLICILYMQYKFGIQFT